MRLQASGEFRICQLPSGAYAVSNARAAQVVGRRPCVRIANDGGKERCAGHPQVAYNTRASEPACETRKQTLRSPRSNVFASTVAWHYGPTASNRFEGVRTTSNGFERLRTGSRGSIRVRGPRERPHGLATVNAGCMSQVWRYYGRPLQKNK